MTPDSGIGLFLLVKSYFVATFMGILGGVAHAIQEVKKKGWKGWLAFAGDVIVCVFFGQVFYQVGMVFAPDKAIIFTSLGSFWGAKSFDYLRDWIINSVKANTK